jgi:rhamnogalacturonan II specific xylosyltransferase
MDLRKRCLIGLVMIWFLFILYTFLTQKSSNLYHKEIHETKETNNLSSTNWTILMTVNDAYFDFFQNWFHFYQKLQLKYPLIVIAEDDVVFLKLIQLNGNTVFTLVRSWRTSHRSAVVYGSKGFNELASGRPTYILKYLEKGTNILYADTDSVWLHDPVPYFLGKYDMWMQLDSPRKFCTGLMAIKSNNESFTLMRLWEASLKERLDIDQTAFNKVYRNSSIHLKPLDRNLFPSGNLYFDQFSDAKRKNVIIVHNNYIVGHEKKLKRFEKFKLWFSDLKAN